MYSYYVIFLVFSDCGAKLLNRLDMRILAVDILDMRV